MVRRNLALLSILLIAALAAGACQEKREPTVSLTQEQWKRVKRHIVAERPEVKREVGATFGLDGEPLIELVGFAIEPEELTTGKEFSVEWVWNPVAEIDRNWKIFVHVTPRDNSAFQNLDHHPVDNLYQTSLWEAGDFILDKHTGTLQAGFPSEGAIISVGFFDEQTGERLTVLDPGSGTSVEDHTKLEVGEVATENDKQLTAYKVAEAPVLDGVLSDPAWRVAEKTAPFVAPTDGKPVDFSTTVRAVYTDEAVYFGFEARDRDLRTAWRNRDDRLWEQDCVEIYLNPDNDEGTYWELQISPGDGADGTPPIFDAYFEQRRQPAWEIAKGADIPGMTIGLKRQGTLNSDDKRANDAMYTLEIEIPFEELQNAKGAINRIKLDAIPPKPGTSWRVNFFRVDYEDTTAAPTRTRHASWSPSGGDFHNLDAFGTLKFGEVKEIGAAGRPTPGAGQQPGARTIPPRVTATLSKSYFVRSGTVLRAGRQDNAALKACIDDYLPPPTERRQFTVDVTVNAEGEVTGILPVEPTQEEQLTYKCIADLATEWEVELQPPRKNGQNDPDWDPASAERIGYQLVVTYTPERVIEPRTPVQPGLPQTPPEAMPTLPGTTGAPADAPPTGEKPADGTVAPSATGAPEPATAPNPLKLRPGRTKGAAEEQAEPAAGAKPPAAKKERAAPTEKAAPTKENAAPKDEAAE